MSFCGAATLNAAYPFVLTFSAGIKVGRRNVAGIGDAALQR